MKELRPLTAEDLLNEFGWSVAVSEHDGVSEEWSPEVEEYRAELLRRLRGEK